MLIRKPQSRELTTNPSNLVLLQAMQAAVTERLPKVVVDADTNATLRQLNAVLGELIHRETDLDALLLKQIHSGQRLLERANGLSVQSSGGKRIVKKKAGPRSTTTLPDRAGLQQHYGQIAQALQDCIRTLPQMVADDHREREQRRRITADIVRWDNALIGALATPVKGPAISKREHSNTSTGPEAVPLQRYLRGRGGVPADLSIMRLQRLSGGFSRATWLLDTRSIVWGQRSLVIRQQMPAGVLDGLFASLRQEYPLLRTLNESGLPVPEQLLLSIDSDNPLGSDFVLMGKAEGRAAGLPTGECYAPGEGFLRDLAQSLAKLHAFDWTQAPERLKSSHLWQSDGRLTRQQAAARLVDHWARFVEKNVEVIAPSVFAALQWLEANAPQGRDQRASILHGDVGFHNMMVKDDRLTALLDWETAHFGDPAKDVAHCKPAISQYVDWNVFMGWYYDAGGEQFSEELLHYYDVFKAVTHVIVCYLARGSRFTRAPGERFELTEMAFVHMPYFMGQLEKVLR